MYVEKATQALKEFATAKEPRVIALSGKWGRGKTYFWTHHVRIVAKSLPGTVKYYSYVSLFGIPSLELLRDAVFENALPAEDLPERLTDRPSQLPEGRPGSAVVSRLPAPARSAVSYYQRIRDGIKREGLRKQISSLVASVPKIKDLGPLVRSLTFLTVTDYVICLDDLERHSDNLSVRDILGFVSTLREQRRCRIVVILNTDAFSDSDRAEYDRFREKVFDYEIVFDPSPEDCAALVLPVEVPHYALATKHAVGLGITNIRVLLRVRRVIDLFYPLVEGLDEQVLGQVVHSAVLLTWAYNSKDEGAPSFDYLRKLSMLSFVDMKGLPKKTEEEERWNERLTKYGYSDTDDLDNEICRCLEEGYLDDPSVRRVLATRQDAAVRAALLAKFHDAWALYHGSFAANESELAAALVASFKGAAKWINVSDVSGTATLLRDMGHDPEADELIDHWVAVQSEANPAALDISEERWAGEVKDRRLLDAVDRVARATGTLPTLEQVVRALPGRGGWSTTETRVLNAASEDDYYRLFKSLPSDELQACVRVCLRFEQFGANDPEYKAIGSKARAALIRIGGESALNARRVAAYGVVVLAPKTTSPEAGA